MNPTPPDAATGIVLQTQSDAPPGLLGPWAQSRGLTLRVLRVDRGEPLPDPREVGFVVALGSDKSVVDGGLRWIKHELAWLREAVAVDTPVLGICFGGQALAAALGARVYRLPEPEIGWIEVASETLPAGPWISWHEDGFEAPPGATELARNEVSLQAYASGRHLGVQFHPEATVEIGADWDQERKYGLDTGPAEAAAAAATRLFDHFAAHAGLPTTT
jgi:GMP synthase-like glutamine amidotransferase